MTLTTAPTSGWVLPSGAASQDEYDLVIDDRVDGWQYTGLRVLSLHAGQSVQLDAGKWELVVVPLSGGLRVDLQDAAGNPHAADLAGRPNVFAGPTDVAYVPAASTLRLTAGDADGRAAGELGVPTRVAICAAKVPAGAAEQQFAHLPATAVPVELRGAGMCSREVRNFATPGVLNAARIIACEVITPAGNWSSYPPHKHDEERPGLETELEEIYYFETQVEGAHTGRVVPAGADPVGYQRVYGTDARPIDVMAEVRTGDVVLVPHGWHGPAMAAPGYDLYYLNVMAGPGESRAWLICDDPQHGWIRESWTDQPVDPRLPFGGAR